MIILLRLLTIVITGLILYIAYQTKNEGVAICAFSGFIAGVMFMGSYVLAAHEKLKHYKRELEKTSINSDENGSKISVLESKIQVLEKALADALKK